MGGHSLTSVIKFHVLTRCKNSRKTSLRSYRRIPAEAKVTLTKETRANATSSLNKGATFWTNQADATVDLQKICFFRVSKTFCVFGEIQHFWWSSVFSEKFQWFLVEFCIFGRIPVICTRKIQLLWPFDLIKIWPYKISENDLIKWTKSDLIGLT